MTKPELLREIGIHLKKVVDIYNQLAKNPEAFTPGEIDMMVNNATKIIEFAAVIKHQPASALNSDEQIKLRDLEDKLRVIGEQLKAKENEVEKLQQSNKELEKKVEENKHLADAFKVDIPEVSDKVDSNSTLAKNDLLNDSIISPVSEIETVVSTTSTNGESTIRQSIENPSIKAQDDKKQDDKKQDDKKNETVLKETPDPFGFNKEKKVDTTPQSLLSKYENETEESNKKTVISSLNESIIDGSQENIAEKMMNSKVKDLKKAIPLHEKFHYTNELFGKNGDHYTQFLEALQTKQSWTEAESLLAQAASMYKWDPENKTALQFIALIQRRFD